MLNQDSPQNLPTDVPKAPAADLRAPLLAIREEIGKAVVGQHEALTTLVITMLCEGHVLLEGVPGVAKTLLARSLAQSIDVDMRRVQFTPDLMPGDITGSLVFNAKEGEFEFREGPVFTNILLADEINRTPPKTQSALLEVMEERQVSVDGTSYPLPDPFFVVATQNPLEFDGTYALPEALADRFLLKATLPVPAREVELAVVSRHQDGFNARRLQQAGIRAVATPASLAAARQAVQAVQVQPAVLEYLVDLCRATRSAPSLALGVSPRATTALLATSKAWAWLQGRDYVIPDDVRNMAFGTLAHRVRLTAEAEIDGVDLQQVLQSVFASVPVPR